MAILRGDPSDYEPDETRPRPEKQESQGYVGEWEDRQCVTCGGPCCDRRGAVAGTRCGRCRNAEGRAELARQEKRLPIMACFVCGLSLGYDPFRLLGLHEACRDRLRAAQRDDKNLSVRRVGLRRG